MDEHLKVTLDYLKKVADRFGYVLNPDEKGLDRISRYMTENKVKFGKYYCPCKQHYPVDRKADPVCPCEDFNDEIKRDGHCECHVFFELDAARNYMLRSGLLSTVTCPG